MRLRKFKEVVDTDAESVQAVVVREPADFEAVLVVGAVDRRRLALEDAVVDDLGRRGRAVVARGPGELVLATRAVEALGPPPFAL